ALAERDLMRAVRQVVAARREAYDPRLEELVRVVTAVEALWRGRMGERRFEAWLRGPIDGRSAAAAGAGEDPAATDGAERPRQALAPPQQGPLVGATDWYAWRDASSLAWQRVHDLAKAVGAHAGRIGRRAGENGEAMAELARRMQRVVAASRPLAVDGR
ncbi:MAG: hypothetical protein KAI24_20080, partial [Planctomycetes bacterium]|nr:hypothetical protein [Planctomycetota bacterium]